MTCDHVEAMCIYQCIINVVVVSHTGGGNQSARKKTTDKTIYIDFFSPLLVFELTTLVVIIYGADVVVWSRALDIRLQCINGVSSNPVEGRTKI